MNDYPTFLEIRLLLQLIADSVDTLKKQPNLLKQDNELLEEEYLNINEASKFLHMPIATIRHHKRYNQLPYKKPGKQLLFVKDELKRWVETFAVNPDKLKVIPTGIIRHNFRNK